VDQNGKSRRPEIVCGPDFGIDRFRPRAISYYDKQQKKRLHNPNSLFLKNETSFKKRDLLKLPKLITLSN
jgi:hypothetical protein